VPGNYFYLVKLYKDYITLASSKYFTIKQLYGGAGA